MVERCEVGEGEWAAAMARRMLQYGGAALIVDYGYNGPPKNSQETLQALRNHQYHDPLQDPGTADLTAHVDFHAIKQAAAEEGAAGYGPVTQGDFLEVLGARARLDKLCENATDEQKSTLISGLERLLLARTNGGSYLKSFMPRTSTTARNRKGFN